MTMAQHRDRDDEDAARRTAALMGFIVILVLAIAAIFLVRELRSNANLEDCLMSGRHNCAPIEAPARRPY
jgi:heme/copper-type cytochrome/quinol oxidase subunit 2